MPGHEEEVQRALEDVLAMYDIKLDLTQDNSEEAKAERFGDYSEIISKTQERLDELSEKAEAIYQRTGMSREELEAYAANPQNFTKEEWDALQRVKDACDKYKRESTARIGEEQFEESEKKVRQKQPHRFAKKKNWLQM